ncbi:MAG: flagellar hook-length control protein FliK [Rhizobacter sp.]|nr:flagellar hook-length control protein FliK [Rhizobacter sp.]
MPTTIQSPLIAALSAATPLAATTGRAQTQHAGASFSRQLEQLRDSRSQEPARARTPEKPKPQAQGSKPPQPQANRPRDNAAERPSAREAKPRANAQSPEEVNAPRPEDAAQAQASAAQGDKPDAESTRDDGLPKEAQATTIAQTTEPLLVLDASTPQLAALVATAGATTLAPTAAAATPAPTLEDPAIHAKQAATDSVPTVQAGVVKTADDAGQESAAQAGLDGNATSNWRQAQIAALTPDGTRRTAKVEVASTTAVPATPTLSAPLAALGHASPHAAGVGAPVGASLATPTTSPDFRAALGLQVSMLARNGVQSAELQLNPPEMGPVSIQIVLDGRHAQINFGADMAQTRQLIESGMPELASALRDAGLTLTGGGVSQHGGGKRGDAESNSAPDGTQGDPEQDLAPTGAGADRRRSGTRIAAGGIDTYA